MEPGNKLPIRQAEEGFIKVSFTDTSDDEGQHNVNGHEGGTMYKKWVENSSAARSDPGIFGVETLRKLYPNHSVVVADSYALNLLAFPGAYTMPLNPEELITTIFFIPLARRVAGTAGILVDSIEYGSFKTAWDKYEFTVFIVKYTQGFGIYSKQFIVHEGSELPSRELLLAIGSWSAALHEEILVFNQGFWAKDHALWEEVQKADWKEIILEKEFKEALQKDVLGFFKSEDLYKKLAIPWKRGLILYGPPGNGKTISIKAIMKMVDAEGHALLYIKSFQSWQGEEASMQDVFDKARQMAPCVVVLEDLDSLINDRNRSFFLNQLDGLVGNDGLLVIGSTNHFERLDPGLSSRPSRFDRKFNFDNPDNGERLLYAKYWQNKLKENEDIDFPDALAIDVANLTFDFSFAYLKEVFVSALVLLAGIPDKDKEKSTFGTVLKGQIKELRKQLDKLPSPLRMHSSSMPGAWTGACSNLGSGPSSYSNEGMSARVTRTARPYIGATPTMGNGSGLGPNYSTQPMPDRMEHVRVDVHSTRQFDGGRRFMY